MIDSKQILNNLENTVFKLGLKGVSEAEVRETHGLLVRRNRQIQGVETLRAERNRLSREFGSLMGGKKGVSKEKPPTSKEQKEKTAQSLKEKISSIKVQLSQKTKELEQTEITLEQSLLNLPNLPHEKAPKGKTAEESPVIKTEGYHLKNYKSKTFRPHWEIAEDLKIYDQKRASKLSGSLFSLLSGPGAKLLRALVSLAYKIYEEDYREFIVPSLVNSKTFTGTGHLPKFAHDAYHIEKDDLWLIPTGEVPLTALHGGEILKELPLKYMTYTSCFRREAGAAGQETRGMQRLHEFHKVELVKICHPENSDRELESLLEDALKPIKALKLPYRVLDLCTGDLTFASARTYDIEVYSPGTDQWLEVSSVGLFTDYQTRRANIRYRKGGGQLLFPHALNGSGLATPRVWAALLEHYEQEDGRVLVPEALREFMGCKYIEKP